MTQEDISRLDHPNHYKKRESPMNAWLNVIYKMMAEAVHSHWPENTGVLGETKEASAKRRSRCIWNIVSDSKEVSVHDTGRHFPFGSSQSL